MKVFMLIQGRAFPVRFDYWKVPTSGNPHFASLQAPCGWWVNGYGATREEAYKMLRTKAESFIAFTEDHPRQ